MQCSPAEIVNLEVIFIISVFKYILTGKYLFSDS